MNGSVTWSGYGLILVATTRDVIFHILFFMSFIQTSFVLPTTTFLVLACVQFGYDALLLMGLMTSVFFCIGSKDSKMEKQKQRILQYITFLTKSIVAELWLFVGVIYWYQTYNEDVAGLPTAENNPKEFGILQGLFLWGMVVCALNIIRWLDLTIDVRASKKGTSGTEYEKMKKKLGSAY